MLSEWEARRRAEEFVHGKFGDACRLASQSRAVKLGWVFEYDTALAFFAAEGSSFALLGTAPIFVDARNGATFALAGPSEFWAYFLSEYAQRYAYKPPDPSQPLVRQLFEAWRTLRATPGSR